MPANRWCRTTTTTASDGRRHALFYSQILALHLDRSIARYKEPDLTMNKILEAAKLVAERKKAYDDRAQAIIEGIPALDSKANQAFERPEGLMKSTEQDFKDLHKVFDDALLVSNEEKKDETKVDSKQEGTGSQDSLPSFPDTDKPATTAG